MYKLSLLLLIFAGCDTGLGGPEICHADPVIAEVRHPSRERKLACPATDSLHYVGTGCVTCVYYDQCGGDNQIAGCSPAPGVWCIHPAKPCPQQYDREGTYAAGPVADDTGAVFVDGHLTSRGGM